MRYGECVEVVSEELSLETYAGLGTAVIENGSLDPWDQEMRPFLRRLQTTSALCQSSQTCSVRTYRILHTGETIEHDSTVATGNVIQTRLHRAHRNRSRHYIPIYTAQLSAAYYK